MDKQQIERILQHPDFKVMEKKKSALSTIFSVLILAVYFTYILLIAFNKPLFATPISSTSVTTIGVMAGFSLIAFAVIITGIYVAKANGEFDKLTQKVVEDIQDGKI